ncbi:TIGR03619 family F420-dependent LLM class oxidoreductase [Cumulibacter soli]|uniref:TIGR03619 family F420-dependent LLM class oxidoreductase n=1 Tax=Cumulibacter soli TaxID=2546344 RepID=UPI001067C91D|nr:TIGR03619 family F420-dependent LLM class oxidoreductase [Cumulibacter soli]
MKIGLMVPQFARTASASALRDVGQAAEELGYSTLWTGDHVVLPEVQNSFYPFSDDGIYPVPKEGQFYDPFATLAFLAGVTSRIALGTGVCVVPYRDRLVLAKSIATVDQVSEGRLIFGAGAGWLSEEFDALGVDFSQRGKITNETLELLEQAFGGDTKLDYSGQYVAATDVHISPQLHQKRTLPVWIGGASKAALNRTARFATTWFPHVNGSTEQFLNAGSERIRARKAELGLEGSVDTALFVPIEVTDHPTDDGPAHEQWIVRGTVDQIREVIEGFSARGVSEALFVHGGSVRRRIETMQRLVSGGVLEA